MTDASSNAASVAARGTLITVLLRTLSFLCTQVTFRLVDPSVLGKAHVESELVLTSILFLSREGFRLVLAKQYDAKLARWTIVVHTVVAVVAYLVFSLRTREANEDLDYQRATLLYCLAAWMEGWAEPAVLWCLATLQVGVKVSAEGMATIAKTFGTILFLRWFSSAPVTAFGLAQILYAATYNIVVQVLVKKDKVHPDVSEEMASVSLIATFTLQSIFKHALTEGDRIVLLTVSEHYDQGLYAIGSSYGGMAARLLLQPLEENARLLWIHQSQLKKNGTRLLQSYTVWVKLVVYVGLLFAAIAIHYTHVLMVLLGQTIEAAPVVAAFCVYTAFLAFNGMTEAFVYGVASSKQDVAEVGLAHTIVGVCFAFLAPYAVHEYGTVGLIAANACCMALRGSYAVFYAARYFRSSMFGLFTQMIPNPPVALLGFALSFFVTQQSELHYRRQVESLEWVGLRHKDWLLRAGTHVGVGIACVIGIATLVVASERTYLRSLQAVFAAKREVQTKSD